VSIEFFEISFSVKNPDLADLVRQYGSKRKKADCNLQVEGDWIKGNYYSSEYDEEWDGWEPAKKIPSGSSTIKWLLDVMSHGALITKTGIKQMANNLQALEEDVEEYEIAFFKSVPEAFGENCVFLQKCIGNQIVSYEMGAADWEDMWSCRNRDKAKKIFDKHDLDMQDYTVTKSSIGDSLDYLRKKPVFMDLIEEFGDKKVINRAIGDEELQLKSEIQELLADLEPWIVSPETIDINGKTVGIGVYSSNRPKQYTSWGERMRLLYFVESSIAQLGGASNNSNVGSKVDVAIIVRDPEDYTTDYQICNYYKIPEIEKVTFVYGGESIHERMISDKEYNIGKLAVFKEYLEEFAESFNKYNTKRITMKKPKPPIVIVFEDQWFEYLARLDSSNTDYHKERQLKAKEMVTCSPYIDHNEERIADVYHARLEGREIEL